MYYNRSECVAQAAPPHILADLPAAFQPSETGLYAQWQPQFAEHEIATFPVVDKAWAVKNVARMGLKASRGFAEGQFRDANAFGFVAGARSGITILDIDSDDENQVADAMGLHGETPIVVRTRSGGHHLWYAHHGEEGRHIKPWEGRPYDQLAGGLVLAPPSKGRDGGYEIVAGRLDNIPDLPTMRNPFLGVPTRAHIPGTKANTGRNKLLFTLCLRDAPHCTDLDNLLDCAETHNQCFEDPLDDDEVGRIAHSAWGYQERGENYVAGRCAIIGQPIVNKHISDAHLIALWTWIKANNKPDARFMLADGLQQALGWSRIDFRRARTGLTGLGWIEPLNKPRPGKPVFYRFGSQANKLLH